ncbi:MAG: DEAD/DEAH box helicase [Acidimicrobiales bacterium]
MSEEDRSAARAAAALHPFHPTITSWFNERFPAGPTEAQIAGWEAVRSGGDCLIAAPTGSGKTMAGFLVAIDSLWKAAAPDGIRVVYVSPLKALATDIEKNLTGPLAEMSAAGGDRAIKVAVRTGDTPASARQGMLRQPPHILVTTPESLYLLLTAAKSRQLLSCVETVIVDEVHALSSNKRGAHLSLSLERLERLQVGPRPVRIGMSATVAPLDTVARFLTGTGPGRMPARIVEIDRRRLIDLQVELPGSELEAVASAEQMGEIYDSLAKHVLSHTTTIVFVNTRRQAERIAHQLAERLGPDQVAAHHGSLSRQRRQRTEDRLRAGELSALVATASLELGIDIGPVDLVCQVGSSRSISTLMQRAGRSNHTSTGVPSCRLYPTSRDELVECLALASAIRSGILDAIEVPEAPLDVLAQQVVAEVAAADWSETALLEAYRAASAYAGLKEDDFAAVIELVSDGITTGRGRRGAYLHRDSTTGMLRARRGARLAALTSGGAIPETGDYRVLVDPDDTVVGSLNEDFAVESMPGDVFLLGTHSWRIKRVEPGVVRVTDAQGAPPSVPFWLGEAPSRTAELSAEVSRLRAAIEPHLTAGDTASACSRLAELSGAAGAACYQAASYLAAGRQVLGRLPTQERLVVERSFDDVDGTHVVVHSPFGGRLNRAFGLALRKRFCVRFDFELQAAATDDAIVLSLGPQHSFPLEDIARFLSSATLEDTLSQAVLGSPMFTARWRWVLNGALVVLRYRAGRKNPLPIQRMEADDLMAAVFPALAGCQDNAPAGPLAIPDHVLVRQTMADALNQAMDLVGLERLVGRIEAGEVEMVFVEPAEPSLLAHEVLNAAPYAYLDDAPLEERRTQAARARRGQQVEPLAGQVLEEAWDQVRSEVSPSPRDADELHDLLCSLVLARPEERLAAWFSELQAAGRAFVAWPPARGAWPQARGAGPGDRDTASDAAGGEGAGAEGGGTLWAATDRRELVERILVDDSDVCDHGPVAEALRGHLETTGPVSCAELAGRVGLSEARVTAGLLVLEGEGAAVRVGTAGRDAAGAGGELWCARRLAARASRYSVKHRRSLVKPATARDLMRFLLSWQHAAPGSQLQGRRGVSHIVEQLQGYEVAAAAWEGSVLPARVESYRQSWLDDMCLSGELCWGRFTLRRDVPAIRRGSSYPSRSTPIALAVRGDLAWLLQAARGGAMPAEPSGGPALDIWEALSASGASFPAELQAATGRLESEVEDGLWDLVASGLVTADSFSAIRSLLSARLRRRSSEHRRHPARYPARHPAPRAVLRASGRFSLLRSPAVRLDVEDLAEKVAGQLLARWGIVWFDLYAREDLSLPWREIVWALRRMELRGTAIGGRFVTGFTGEQYALAQAAELLRQVASGAEDAGSVTLSGADPLNLTGSVLPGERVPGKASSRVTIIGGLPITDKRGA